MHAKIINVIVILCLACDKLALAGNAFDPSLYLDERAKSDATKAREVTSRAIVRLDGRRYHRFTSPEGSVYLPGTGDTPDMLEELALCDAHLKLYSEVLLIRENIAIEATIKKFEKRLIAMIRKCLGVRVDAPTVSIETPDGTLLEMKETKRKDAGRNDKRKPRAKEDAPEGRRGG